MAPKSTWVDEIYREGLRQKIDSLVVLGNPKPHHNTKRAQLAAHLFWNYPFTHVVVAGTTPEMNELEHYLYHHFVPSDRLIRVWANSDFDQVQNAKHWGHEQFKAGHSLNRLLFIGHDESAPVVQMGHEFTKDIPGCKTEFQSCGKLPSAESEAHAKKGWVEKMAITAFPFLYLTNHRHEKSVVSQRLTPIVRK